MRIPIRFFTKRYPILIGLFIVSLNSFSETREIALTIDDLPLVGSKMNTPGNQQRSTERFNRIVQTLKDNQVPAVGFVIGGAIEKGQWEFLEQFRQAGLIIGNHTYSHRNLNQIGADKYIADIARADAILAPLMTGTKYFRYPYLAEGNSKSKPLVLEYLTSNHYVIAPVTIDSKDFRFNEQLYHIPYRSREAYIQNQMKPRYLAYIWQQTLKAEKRANGQPVRQILLIHANVLNSYVLEDIIQMYKKNGYRFITLAEALENPAPGLSYPAVEKTPVRSEETLLPPIIQEVKKDN